MRRLQTYLVAGCSNHQQACVCPECTVCAHGWIFGGWPLYPVGLVVWNAVEPLNDRDVDSSLQ